MKNWLKFFGLSFFSDSLAGEAGKHGYRNLIFAVALALAFFLAGVLCAEVVPFPCHYGNSGNFVRFAEASFEEDGSEERIVLTVQNGGVKAGKKGEPPAEAKLVNTYTSAADAEAYSLGGYQLIVDTRPANTPVKFTQTAVSAGGEAISYESYLALPNEKKQEYSIKTSYTDEEISVEADDIAKFEAFLENSVGAAEEYKALQSEKASLTQNEYGFKLYALYTQYYFDGVKSVTSSKVPVLRDYYYHNYVTEKKYDYLYIFGDIVYGSFATDAGLRVNFGGYCSAVSDGEVNDISAFINQIFYSTAGNLFASNLVNSMTQLPAIAIVPFVAALPVWLVKKFRKRSVAATYGGSLKTVGSFIWFSALLTGLIAFILGFFVNPATIYWLMLPVYTAVIFVRSAIFIAVTEIRESKINKTTDSKA